MKTKRYALGNIEVFIGTDGEVELSRRWDDSPASIRGKGSGDLTALRLVWGMILTSARRMGLRRLYCEPTTDDGRGRTRIAVYRRAGFKITATDGDYVFMEYIIS